jgi:hypothetical protein
MKTVWRRWSFFAFVCLGVLAFHRSDASSERRSEIRPYRVQVKVSGDEGLRRQVTSCLAHALSKLPDVMMAEDLPDYRLRVIAMKVVTESRKNVGLSFSVLVTAPYTNRVESLAQAYVSSESRPYVVSTLTGAEEIVSHWIQTGSAEDVEGVCRSIVASFDEEAQKKSRQPQRGRE